MNIEPVLDGIAIQHRYLHPIWPDLSPQWKTIGNKPSLGFLPPCASGNLALRRTSPDGIGVSSAPFGLRCSVHWHLAVWIWTLRRSHLPTLHWGSGRPSVTTKTSS